jgi:hypothetical protein
MDKITTDFITATKKIHADVRTILTTLHLIREDVKLIHEDNSTANDRGKSGEKHPSARSVNSPKENDETYETKQYALDQKHFGLEQKAFKIGKWTLAVLAVYTLLMFWQACLSRKLISNTSEQFQKDIRPYVWETGFTPPDTLHFVEGEPVTFDIGWINYGKSPALNVRQKGIVCLGIQGVQAMELADMLYDEWDGKRIDIRSKILAHGGTKQMGDQAQAAVDTILANPPPVLSRTTVIPPGIPPNDLRHPFGGLTIITSRFAPPDFNYVSHTDYAAVAATRTEYTDLQGTYYWSDVCLARLADGSIVKCPRHNELH